MAISRRAGPEDRRFSPIWRASSREHGLPLQLFHDLLDAFSQDVVKKRYADFAEVLDYCRRSANPVGRLLLHLFGKRLPREPANAPTRICSALQLINFWQDVDDRLRARTASTCRRTRCARFGVSEEQIARAAAATPPSGT